MPINRSEISEQLFAKVMQCSSVEELISLAESEGVSLTKEEAAAYLAEMSDCELDDEVLKQAAGGADCYSRSHRQCNY